MDDKKSVKVSDTSITSFNDLITDLLVPNVDLDNKSGTFNKQVNNPTENEKKIQNVKNEKDKITMDKLDDSEEKKEIDVIFKEEKLQSQMKDTLNEREKFRMISDQFKIEIGILKSQYEEHAEERIKWEELENTLLTKQKNHEQMLKDKNHEVKGLNEKLDIQQALINDKDNRIIKLQDTEKENEALREINDKMKTELQNEIQELKETKTDITSLLNIKKSLDEQESEKKIENIGQQTEFKEKECQSSVLDRDNSVKKINILKEKLVHENKETEFMDKNASILNDLKDKDELIAILKLDLKKRGMLLKDTQSHIATDELKSLKEKLEIQHAMITDKDKTIKELQDGISEAELGNVELSERNSQMKERLQNEIEELKEIKTELTSKFNIKQDLDGQDFKKQAGILKEQLNSKGHEYKDDMGDVLGKDNLAKEIKILKDELARGHEENTQLLEENQLMKKNVSILKDSQNKDDMITKLKIDLKKRGVLLKDAQTYIDLLQKQSNNHTLKQLKSQIENLESDKNTIIRQKKNVDYELEEVKTMLDTLSKKNQDLEEKYRIASKENSSLSDQVLENEEEVQEIMKKYKSSVASITNDQITLQAQAMTIIEYEQDNVNLKETNANLVDKLEELEAAKDTSVNKNHLQMKVSELEHKVELEKSTRSRMEMQIARLRETVEKIDKESEELRLKSQCEQEKQRKLFNQLRDHKEDYVSLQRKEANVIQMMNILENKLLIKESENVILKKELEMALGRIDDFQIAINSEISSETDTIHCSDEEIDTLLEVQVSNTKSAQEIKDWDNKIAKNTEEH